MPGTVRLWRQGWRAFGRRRSIVIAGSAEPKAMTALTINKLCKAFGGLRVTTDVNLNVEPGERRLIIGPNGAGKTTLFNLITGELTPDSGSVHLLGQDITGVPSRRRAASRHGAHLSDHHAVRPRHHRAQCHAGAARPFEGALESADACIDRNTDLIDRAHEALAAGRPAAHRRPPAVADLLRRAAAGRDRHGAGAEPEGAAARRAVTPASRSTSAATCRRLLRAIPRDVTIVMIEHNMDVALDFAERITLLHFGKVIVEGTRAEVVADPHTREVYLGH